MTSPTRRPPGRYDEPRASNRLLLRAAALVLGIAVAASIYALYARYTEGRVSHQVRGYEVLSDTGVRISFEVRLDRGQRGECKVRARGRDGVETGSAIVPVGPGTGGAFVTSYDLSTSSRASTGEVAGCRSLEQP